jgi:PQQ-dependent catabolism-associated CXXCW motif protein
MGRPFRLVALLLLTTTTANAQDSFGGTAAPAPARPRPSGSAAAPVPCRGTTPAPEPAVDPTDPEREDFGVPATPELHTGSMHDKTPSTIPGGQVITTRGLVALLAKPELNPLVFDVLGWNERLPGSLAALPAHQAGSYNDQTQQEFGKFLNQVTRGNKETPLVFYCMSKLCWNSYNASLRAINMGYRNVLWYRGGLEAWKAAGQKVAGPGQ